MEKHSLKLVGMPRQERLKPVIATCALALMLLACALLCTLLGADSARSRIDPKEMGQELIEMSLQSGTTQAEIQASLIEMRRLVARRPLDTRARVVYSSLLLNFSSSIADTEAAAFHAGLSAELAPVTVPIVRTAALVLARCGELSTSLDLTRYMFSYDPVAAAGLLFSLRALASQEQIETGIAASPDAWLAWVRELRQVGYHEEAHRWLSMAHDRWPDHLAILQNMAARLAGQGDWEALSALLPPERLLPDEPDAAVILTYRARLKNHLGDTRGGRQDLERALGLAGDSDAVKILAGDAYLDLGDVDEARTLWRTVLFTLDSQADEMRRGLLLRLARLEDRHGEPAAALRIWRQLLEIDPDHREANRRIAILTGA
jgi:tetratricopeptide (TPR) repeat protein